MGTGDLSGAYVPYTLLMILLRRIYINGKFISVVCFLDSHYQYLRRTSNIDRRNQLLVTTATQERWLIAYLFLCRLATTK